jgi:hypothetical protein
MAASRHPPAPPDESSADQAGQGQGQDRGQSPGQGLVPAPPGPRPPGQRKTYGPVPVPPPLRPPIPSTLRQPQGRGHGRSDDEGDEQTTVDPQAARNLRMPDDLAPSLTPPSLSPPSFEPPSLSPPSFEPSPMSPPSFEGPPLSPPSFEPPSLSPPPFEPPPLAPPPTTPGADAPLEATDGGDPGASDADLDQKSTTTTEAMDDSAEIVLDTSDALGPLTDHLAAGTGETGGASLDEPTVDEARNSAPQLAAVPVAAVAQAPERAPAALRPGPRNPSSPSSPSLSPAWLVVQSGTDRGRRFALRTARTSVGRGVDNDVVLTDIAVSRKHLTVDFDGSSYFMNDLGSGNGTLVNDRDEDASFRLSHGDKLELGNTVLVFESTALGQAVDKWPAATGLAEEEYSTVAGHGSEKSGSSPEGNGAAPPIDARPSSLPRAATAPPPLPPPRSGPRSGQMLAAVPPAAARPLAAMPAPPMAHALPNPASPAPARGPGGLASTLPSLGVPPPRGPTSPPPPLRPRPQIVPTAPASARTMSTEAAIALANRQAPAPSPGGYSPYPPGQFGGAGPRGLGPSMSYPAAPAGYGMSPSTASSPRFQYPNGVMAPLAPTAERRRVLIGILALAFVAVGAGIVMALVHGGGGEAAEARRKPAPSGAAKTAQGADTATTAQPPAGAGAVTAAAGQPDAPAAEAAARKGGAASPALLHHLYGDQELRPIDFGTDEQFLSDGGRQPVAQQGDGGAGAGPIAQTVPDEGEGESTDDKSSGRDGRDDRRHHHRDSHRRTHASAEPDTSTSEDDPSNDDEESGEDDGSASGPALDADAALKRASSLYRSKKFTEAAGVLRRSADTASGRTASRLRELAAHYARVGQLLSDGQEAMSTDSPKALVAFKSALRLDEDIGDGVHDRSIGARIAQVAPAAAGAYMARKDYPEAKQAADMAEKFGAGERVTTVRDSLERKAKQLLDEARSQAEAGNKSEAAESARLILQMVPRSSDLYSQAARLAGQ